MDDLSPVNFEMPRLARPLSQAEADYMRGGKQPVTSSVLVSNSKFLNSPLFREAWTQMSLRRHGPDLPEPFCIPMMIRGIYDVIDVADFVAEIAAEKARNPEFRDWLNERRLTAYRGSELRGHADGTLGAVIREFVEASGMELDFTGIGEEITNDFDYMVKRRGLNHDIEHMVTGFGPNSFGEEALAMCNSASIFNYFPPQLAHYAAMTTIFVTGASYMRNAMHYPAAMPHHFDAIQRGIKAGLSIKKPLFMVQWEDYLDWPVDDICAELGIERGPDKMWIGLDHLTHG
jgi:ubiquinone biosynthesis protein COQ4